MRLNHCGLDQGTINYLRKIALREIINRDSDYFGREVVHLTIADGLQIDVVGHKTLRNRLKIVKLGVQFDVHDIEYCQIYKTISTIIDKHRKSKTNENK